MPFTGDVVVREISDDTWRLVEPLEYWGNTERFVVEAGFETDFASVPRIFTWLLPRYGKYTKAAILHDWLCARARRGLIARSDADGLFRRSMRELGVPFLKRWLMWAAVRVDAAKHGGPRELLRPSVGSLLSFLALALGGLAYVLVPGLVILAALLVFFLAEWLAFLPLAVAARRRRLSAPPVPVPSPAADDLPAAVRTSTTADAPGTAAGAPVPQPLPAGAGGAVPRQRKAVNRPRFSWTS